MSNENGQMWSGISGRDFPTLKPTTEATGAALTPEILDRFFARMTSPEYAEQRRQAEERAAEQERAAWEASKRVYARHLGVEELSKEQIDDLCHILLEQQLAMRGLTVQDFDDFFGV